MARADFADAYSNIGAIYKETKNYAPAMPYYQKALAPNSNHTNANFDVALIELSLTCIVTGKQIGRAHV